MASGLFALRVSPPRPVRYLLGAGGLALLILVWWLATMGPVETRLLSPVVLPSQGPRRQRGVALTSATQDQACPF